LAAVGDEKEPLHSYEEKLEESDDIASPRFFSVDKKIRENLSTKSKHVLVFT
jgi:hypothetical protein